MERVHRETKKGYRGLGRHLGGLRRSKWHVLGAIFLGIIAGFSGGFGVPVLLRHMVSSVFMDEALTTLPLIFYCCLPILLMGMRTFSGFLSTYLLAAVGQEILQDIRLKIFQKLQRLPIAFFRKTQAGQLVSKTFNDANVIQSCFVSIAHEIIQRPATLISAIGAIVFLCLRQTNGWVLLMMLLLMGISGLPIAHFGRAVWDKNLRAQENIAALTSRMASNLQSVQEVRAFCMERREIQRFRRANRAYARAYLDTCRSYYLIVPSVECWAAFGMGLAFFLARCLRIPGETFLAIATALFFAYDPIKNIGRLYGNLQYAISSLSRIDDLLNEEEIGESTAGAGLPKKLCGEIVFRNVSFAYDAERSVFRDLNLTLQAGKSYAVVGPSGSGKSTLVNLILRFYEVQEGKLTVGGYAVEALNFEELRSAVAFVPQQPTLLHDTVAANIRWGKPTASREELLEAARRARALEFIEKLPRGLDTVIGEDGNYLSGGQRQRIALARAFLKNAPILILDEATSALDTQSEREMRSVLPNLFEGRTVLLISHCFQWLPHVDEIIVLDGGRIVQRGTHGQLLGQEGLYRQLHGVQGDV
ncbi:MAG: ABC transporter ATP-binding protein/permease [Puniceicoccales bacterium]|jgi:subfamily B ATP-binding cassette protein MsbA|nr:ABC transporter ATP-binding protein/permease [Puniceicoccales bacterium]